ncbi:rhodanese-related sulfurtransferase [Bradyrhizobium sp. i1.7.7]
MKLFTVTPADIRRALLLREEIALLDLRYEAGFATGHPLFAANMAADRIAIEAELRLPRKDVAIVLYDDGEGLVATGAERLAALGYTNVSALDGGLKAWRDAGYQVFEDVNSYSKAFGELVEARRHTPSFSADEVAKLIADKADIAILDVRRFDEYATMNIPGSVSVPGAELVLRAGQAAPDPETTIIVNCAGRTRSIIGTQSLINAGVPNKVGCGRCATARSAGRWRGTRSIMARTGVARSGHSRGARPMRATSPIAPVFAISARARRRRSQLRPIARSIVSTCATQRSMRPAISPASAIIPVASSSRKPTWPRPCAARASS